jgi:hypothetical protein
MMKTLTLNEATKLIKTEPSLSISLYLATDVSERDGVAKLRLNLQRLFKKAEASLARTCDAKTRERLLHPLRKALSMIGLKRGKGGIAIYHNEEFTGLVKLPTITSDIAVAADSFHIKPLLRCAQSRRSFFVLALRRRHADLYLVTADGTKHAERIELPNAFKKPLAMDRGEKFWLGKEIKVRRKRDFVEGMKQLNRYLEGWWTGSRTPLLLAGASSHQDAFRQNCNYQHLIERGLVGAVDDLDSDSLTNISVVAMKSYFEEQDYLAVATFRKAEAAGLTTTDLEEVAKAAARGQIQSLLVAEDRHVWGHLDRDTGRVQVVHDQQGTADDLLDDLAELTLNNGGSVTVLPSVVLPNGQLIAAVLRWKDTPVSMPMTRKIAPIYSLHRDEAQSERRA